MERLVMGNATPLPLEFTGTIEMSPQLETGIMYGDWSSFSLDHTDEEIKAIWDKVVATVLDNAKWWAAEVKHGDMDSFHCVDVGEPYHSDMGCPVLDDAPPKVAEYTFRVTFEEPGIDLTRRES